MDMPAESSPFAFPKLDGSNYTSWKEDMKVVLMDRGCWSFIIEDKPCPEQATEKEMFEIDEKKTQVKEADFEIPELLIALQLIRTLQAEYDHLVQTLYRLKDEEFNHREVEKGLETRKKSFERSGAVLDLSRNPGQYRKISYPKGMRPFCDFCSRKGHDASKCYKKRNKEKKQAFASETSICETNQAFRVSKDWDQFLVDTAATSHFCYERDWFKTFKELTTTKALRR
ncbi:hypothetical protein AVEN_129220-1 [Araneus ventricosus]|uniref:DUF4219 domain-containing protein n=1 Tax=Araneus ventricosus TaxID=182803 RepID=A0A4Y2CLW8_ARAVE|nr:hypothetical protein AVEN_129220-1 [Araneus ventricosus]